MSQETMQWLNRNVLVGFTDKRGDAWHYLASEQGDEPNHYPGAIPVADVERRLFGWEALEAPITFVNEITGQPATVPNQKVYYRSDTGDVIGMHSEGHAGHGYREWLLRNAGALLDAPDSALYVGQAGLLKGGSVAWVSIEMEETLGTKEGINFRPQLTLATSFNGSIATTYKMMSTITVCDNTLAAGLGEASPFFKIRHTAHSALKIVDARTALGLMTQAAGDLEKELSTLCETTVTDSQWSEFLTAHIPVPEDKGRSRTLAEKRRETFAQLWSVDPRVAPWRNTAYGVLAADNTYRTHLQTVRGAERPERNKLTLLKGESAEADKLALGTLALVLAR